MCQYQKSTTIQLVMGLSLEFDDGTKRTQEYLQTVWREEDDLRAQSLHFVGRVFNGADDENSPLASHAMRGARRV